MKAHIIFFGFYPLDLLGLQKQHACSRLDHQPLRGQVAAPQGLKQALFKHRLGDPSRRYVFRFVILVGSFFWIRQTHEKLQEDFSCCLRRTRLGRVEFHTSIRSDEIRVTNHDCAKNCRSLSLYVRLKLNSVPSRKVTTYSPLNQGCTSLMRSIFTMVERWMRRNFSGSRRASNAFMVSRIKYVSLPTCRLR